MDLESVVKATDVARAIDGLIDMAREMGIENMARSRKQDIIFALLKRHAKSGEDIFGDGVLEILQDGFGFLRSADSSFLAIVSLFLSGDTLYLVSHSLALCTPLFSLTR